MRNTISASPTWTTTIISRQLRHRSIKRSANRLACRPSAGGLREAARNLEGTHKPDLLQKHPLSDTDIGAEPGADGDLVRRVFRHMYGDVPVRRGVALDRAA